MVTTMEHPIALELVSLKAALDKYQHAAHTSSLQLQRAHFEATEVAARSKTLEADNSRLQHEIDLLRANPDTKPGSIQVSELTLALRRVSDKLSLTEDILLQRTQELTHSVSDKSRIQLEMAAAQAQLETARQREEASRLRETDLARKCKAAEEEARMADVVVMEYADLVRSLEGRRSRASGGDEDNAAKHSSPSPTLNNGHVGSYYQAKSDSLIQSLTENRFSLQRLLHEFNSESLHLQAEITRLNAEISSVQTDLVSERENSRLDRLKLADALLAVDRYKTDDSAAARIVSRYMQFSQSSINTLQAALSTVKSRHAATLATMSQSSNALAQSLDEERRRGLKLRDVLDELTEDISRETFGRRREISLRLQCVVREERTVEALGAWIRRAEERLSRLQTIVPATDVAESSHHPEDIVSEELRSTLDHMIRDALAVLTSLSDEERPNSQTKEDNSGRVVLAEDMARSMAADLEREIEKRMTLTRSMANVLFTPSPKPPLTTDIIRDEDPTLAPSSQEIRPSLSTESTPVPFSALDVIPVPSTALVSTEGSSGQESPDIDVAAQPPDPAQVARSPSRSEHKMEQTDLPAPRDASRLKILPLTELNRVSDRYDGLQRAFRDCHLTLAKLKADTEPNALASQLGTPVLQNVLHRLDDFCEDIRVELEIRIADEERIAKGFEALLGVPGALVDETERGRVELELRAFLDGTTPSVVKTLESCTSKLEDLQHDIAQVKRALHESIEAVSEAQPSFPLPKTPPAWPSWTPPFLSGAPSRPASPAPSFGTVITAPKPRRVSSNSFSPLSKTTSESNTTINDPYSHLGLRISMPSQAPPASPLQPSSARLRKTSTSSSMYLLGLASHSGFFPKPEVIAEDSQPLKVAGDGSGSQKSHSDVE